MHKRESAVIYKANFFLKKAAFAFIIIPMATSHGPFSPGLGKEIQAPQPPAKQRAWAEVKEVGP